MDGELKSVGSRGYLAKVVELLRVGLLVLRLVREVKNLL